MRRKSYPRAPSDMRAVARGPPAQLAIEESAEAFEVSGERGVGQFQTYF
jgi:hypothetical protein